MGRQNLQIQHSPKDDMLKQENKIFKISTFGAAVSAFSNKRSSFRPRTRCECCRVSPYPSLPPPPLQRSGFTDYFKS